jgi:acetyl-CoA C-acetyltransferase
MVDPTTPVLIGAGQLTLRDKAGIGPRAMMKAAVERAAADAGVSMAAIAGADVVAVVGFTVDAPGTASRLPVPRLANPPLTLAAEIGAKPKRVIYTHMGGNTPQALVNALCEDIAEGRAEMAVIAGAEFLGGLMRRLQAGQDVAHFGGGAKGEMELFGDPRPGCSPQEDAHGMAFPANVYPMFENAYRAHKGRSLEAHLESLGALFAPMSEVAARNQYAWFPIARSAKQLITDGPDNRMIGYPYPKYLNAIIQVDQAAALILCSSAKADALAVPAGQRVYLHGCSEANELWNPIDRVNYHTAPAIRACGRDALAMANLSIDDIDVFDIYSCFPVAVEIACDELGIAHDDPRGLTLTGGLPNFGGPGNNYAMHGIAEAMAAARATPSLKALITANGWYLTKHAMGIYSTDPVQGRWARRDPKQYQAEIDALAHPVVIDKPQGEATIEAYTVVHARDRMRMGIVIGRDGEGRRFVANTPEDEATLKSLQARESIGRSGTVGQSADGARNIFTPDGV